MGEKIVENITALLLEVIGYLTPPIYLIVLLSLFTKSEYHPDIPTLFQNELLLLILLYAFGYLIRSLSISIAQVNFFNIKKSISDDLKQKETFKKVHEMIKKDLEINQDLSFSEVRNICLGKYPEISNKVYLFMFRSSLFFDLFVINILVALLLIFFVIINYLFAQIIITYSLTNLFLLSLLVLVSLPLLKARNRFFRISYKIPISNYLSQNLS